MRNLSKSKIIAFRQCPKRLWLELYKPELRDDSASETVFKIGHQVGEVARTIYDPQGDGVLIDVDQLGHGKALARSAELLTQGHSTIFEAGMSAEGALAYADVMIPDHSDGSLRWRMVEVKSSTAVKSYHQDDIAVQAHIASASGVRLSSVVVAHIDNKFVYQGDDSYTGLLKEVDLTEQAISRNSEAEEWIAKAQEIAALAEEPVRETGPHCTEPFTCGFCEYCNRGKILPEYPVETLPGIRQTKLEKLAAAGYLDIRDVPEALLSTIQGRIKQCAVSGQPYFDANGAAADLAPHGFPAYFLDFESINLVW